MTQQTPNETTELLPCAHCGGRPEIEDHRLCWSVECTVCGSHLIGDRATEQQAKTGTIKFWADIQQTAVTAWNRRATPTLPTKLTPAMRDAVCPKWTYSPDAMYLDLLESLPPAPSFCGLCRQPVSLCGCVPTNDGPGQPDAAPEVEIEQKGNEP